ncbi:MAG: four helix bundle protein, partial [Phycisphaerae bacterium]|nr:four helix bundle protein [Phycisphaerae bacterium]
RQFALRVIRVFSSLDRRNELQQVIGKQMLRSGTSVGAQYREARRARSVLEFVSKLNSALQELDETAYWFELLVESGTVKASRLIKLQEEADELIAILVASIRTAKKTR